MRCNFKENKMSKDERLQNFKDSLKRRGESVKAGEKRLSERRRKTMQQARPPCMTEDQLKWLNWHYRHARAMERATGERYAVDHIHPLHGKGF